MTDSLNKVKAGDSLKIPAGAYNAFVDAARDFRSRQHSVQASPAGGQQPAGTVKIKNISGSDVGRFQILGIDGVVFNPQSALQAFQSQVVLLGNTPLEANHSGGRFVICAGPIPSGTIGTAWASGTCPVQIDVTDESHLHADIRGWLTANLASAKSGPCSILWKEAGLGVKWALVRFGDLPESTKMFYITAVGAQALTCQEATYNGSFWGYYKDAAHQATVLKYPNFSHMSQYKVGNYIVAIRVANYWVSAYNQPGAFTEYQP